MNQKLKYSYSNNLKLLLTRKTVSDRDIHALIQGTEHEQNALYQVDSLQLQFVSQGLQSAVIVIKDKDGHLYQDSKYWYRINCRHL